jgi:hypothetical protein
LAIALRELGRIERTLFTLDWLQSVELRRRAGRFEQGRSQKIARPAGRPLFNDLAAGVAILENNSVNLGPTLRTETVQGSPLT